MKIRYNCLPCIVNQAIKVAEQTGLENKELLMREVFGFLEHMDYQLTTPEVIREICMDKLLLAEIRKLNPEIQIWFAVRGKPIVNDSIEEDAYFVGIDQYAQVLNNGDGSMGTVLSRVSGDFMEKYNQVDIIIAKGQANYECLSEEKKEIYFLLMTKCSLIANDIGVPEKKMICMKTKGELKNETIDDASVCERE